MQRPQNLTELLQSLTPDSLVVLDIDSTLLLTHKRNEAILKRFAEEKSAELPEFCKLLNTIECRRGEYGYKEALKRVTLDRAENDVLEALHTYWRQHFFSNTYLKHDIPHTGAVRFVETLEEKNIPFVYLTGRPREPMSPGTLEALQHFAFPATKNILFMKPQPKDIDEDFKSKKMAELKKLRSRTVLIDNEPKILNKVAADHPEVELVFVDTCHSPNVTPPEGILTLTDFTF